MVDNQGVATVRPVAERDVPYGADAGGMLGLLVRPIADHPVPAVVLGHDAFACRV